MSNVEPTLYWCGEALGVVLDLIKQDLDRRGFTEELERGNSYSHKEAREGS